MNNRSTVKRLATAVAAGGVLAMSPLVMSPASAQPADCPNYTIAATTTTTLSVSPANPTVGDPFTATATVTVAGLPASALTGDVTFTYAGESETRAVSGGSASATFTAEDGSFTLSATYSGDCLAGAAAIDPSTDSQAIVAGVEATAGGGNGGSGSNSGPGRSGANIGGVSGGTGSSTGGLAGTGLDTQTELYGILGVGLVAVGGLTLMVHRRRVQA
jgi:hypothetical protein